MSNIGVGIYGLNGHQIHNRLIGHPLARLVATAACDFDRCHRSLAAKREIREDPDIRAYADLDGLLEDRRVDVVSLCSPRRIDQAEDAMRCLRAGKHVYAEKPAAMEESELDRVLATAKACGCEFREMAGTVFAQPYYAARELVMSGALGRIVQVYAQKSYRSRIGDRPQDEAVDGGLILQCGIHAVRMIEHVTGMRTRDVEAFETTAGNPEPNGGLRFAASMALRLEGGTIASVAANYLCPTTFHHGQNEHLRVFGANGFLEAIDGGTRTNVYLNDAEPAALDVSVAPTTHLDQFLAHLRGEGGFELSLEDELHPLRVVLRANEKAKGKK